MTRLSLGLVRRQSSRNLHIQVIFIPASDGTTGIDLPTNLDSILRFVVLYGQLDDVLRLIGTRNVRAKSRADINTLRCPARGQLVDHVRGVLIVDSPFSMPFANPDMPLRSSPSASASELRSWSAVTALG